MSFVHLHSHTEYSLLDGSGTIDNLISKCKELGMDSLAITDHGVMYGAVEFYKKAIDAGIKPILGCEIYVAPNSMNEKTGGNKNNYSHLVLLAKNNTGYQNLIKLVSIGFIEGFYYKPRIDYKTLAKYSEGLICLSSCLAGDIPKFILNNDYSSAKKLAVYLNNIFGKDNFYLELQDHNIEEQKIVNENITRLSLETSIPLVVTNDVHYTNKEDYLSHDVLLCIQTGKTIYDNDRMKFESDQFYLKSPDEMKKLFPNHLDALKNSVKIAEMCNVKLDFEEMHLPKYEVPEGYSPKEYLIFLCDEGFSKKYSSDNIEAINRLEYEISIIENMGYIDYFLIVWDFIKYAREQNIIVGPGRGSAAGSIVSYLLNITQIDPLKYNLLFERFLNPERISMPDIDIDFCFERRQEVINYVIKKYGENRVAQIITFGTLAAKAAIRDVGRVLNMSYKDVDKIAKLIPADIGMTISQAINLSPKLKNLYKNDYDVKNLIDMSIKLEGLPRHASTHAAGLVISKNQITDYVPLQKIDDVIVTQYPMDNLEDLGLLKIDLLGLKTLTVIKDTVSLIESNKNIILDINSISLEDEKVFDLLASGDTEGVFQLESHGMKSFLKELKPSSFEDIIAGISLYRPGPMDQIPRYLENKSRPDLIEYSNEYLSNILDVTYGCMVYQEQVMQIVRDIAGYSLSRSDIVRRAMSKKDTQTMEMERRNFIFGLRNADEEVIIPGALSKGISLEDANTIFDEMMEFAKYAFNKSHAAAYALIAYQTAWLKSYYPIEFMAALMTNYIDNSSKITSYIQYCKKNNIEILPPDINESSMGFTVSGGNIRFGLAAIKNIGKATINSIIENRDKIGKYKNLLKFCESVDGANLNKRTIESLIKSGAFDSFGMYRSQLLAIYEDVLDSVSQNKRKNIAGQISIFSEQGNSKENYLISEISPEIEEFSQDILLSMEKEATGIYISGHPLNKYINILNNFNSTLDLASINNNVDNPNINILKDGSNIKLGGIIIDVEIKRTKSNSTMAFVTLEDLYDTVELIIFPNIYMKYSNMLIVDEIVVVDGYINSKDDECKIICNKILPIEEFVEKKLYLKISYNNFNNIEEKINLILEKYSGSIPVILYYEKTNEKKLVNKSLWIKDDENLIDDLVKILGIDSVKLI